MTDSALKLWYDFANENSLSARFGLGPTLDITRATDATYFDSAGVMQTAGSGVARFDHLPVSPFTSLGLLVEEVRTNVAVQSGNMDTSWTKTNAVMNLNAALAPDGTTSMSRLDSTGVGFSSTKQAITVSSGDNTVTVFAEKDINDWVAIQSSGYDAGGNGVTYFDLNNGVTGTPDANHTASIRDVGGGVYRCRITFSTTTDVAGEIFCYIADSDGDANTAASASIFVWGAQLEAGAFPTSYIPTVASSVTKNKGIVATSDVSWLGVANSKYTKFRTGYIGQDTTVWSLHDGTANERIALEITGGNLHFIGVDGGVTQWDISVAVAADAEYEVAVAWAAGDAVMYVDGVQAGTDAASTLPTVTDYNIGSDHADAELLNSTLSEDRSYNERKNNQFLEDLSNGLISETAATLRRNLTLVSGYARR